MLSLRSRFPILPIQCSQMLFVMTRSDCKLDKSWVKLFIDNAATVQDLNLAKIQNLRHIHFLPLHSLWRAYIIPKMLNKMCGGFFFLHYTMQCMKDIKEMGNDSFRSKHSLLNNEPFYLDIFCNSIHIVSDLFRSNFSIRFQIWSLYEGLLQRTFIKFEGDKVHKLEKEM